MTISTENQKDNQGIVKLAVKCMFMNSQKQEEILVTLKERIGQDPAYSVIELFKEENTFSEQKIDFLLAFKKYLDTQALDIEFGQLAIANDFTTVTRVRYVQDCIAQNQGKMNIYESTLKCSCVIDKLSEDFTQVEFENADAGFQYRNIPGDRGAMFKDDTDVQDGIKSFKELHLEAYESCRMRR